MYCLRNIPTKYYFPIILVFSPIMENFKLKKHNLDPFNLNHNLGAGLKQNMFQYIMACFTEARTRFGNAEQEIPGHVDPIDYFFNKDILTSYSDIPKDRYAFFFRALSIKKLLEQCPGKFY